jgi:hypothetical protein
MGEREALTGHGVLDGVAGLDHGGHYIVDG